MEEGCLAGGRCNEDKRALRGVETMLMTFRDSPTELNLSPVVWRQYLQV